MINFGAPSLSWTEMVTNTKKDGPPGAYPGRKEMIFLKKKKEPRTVSIYLRPELEAEIEARGSNRNHIIHRDLERLYTLYRLALREVKLTLSEAWFIVDMLNGTIMDANTAGLLWASAEDACALDGLDKKWQVDGKAFVEKLKKLSDTQALALADAAERFWQANTGTADDEDIKKFFGVAIV